jgi:hypothetical protein
VTGTALRQLTVRTGGVATDNILAARYSSVTIVTSEKSMFDSRWCKNRNRLRDSQWQWGLFGREKRAWA